MAGEMSEKQAGKQPQKAVDHPHAPPPFPPPSCPRCSSDHTKFCYYNNYSVLQPRYFCKDCRRYWTHGGALRNIPMGRTNRKRGRANFASSSSQFLKPPPSRLYLPPPSPPAPSLGFPDYRTGAGSSIGRDTFMPQITATMQSFNGGGCFNQTPLTFSPGGELGGVNTAFGAVSEGLGGGAPPPRVPTPFFPHLSALDDFRDFGLPFLQPPQQHRSLQTIWTNQNMAPNIPSNTLGSPSRFLSNRRDPTAAANVVSSNEWPELDCMNTEGDPLQGYKPPSP